MQTIDPVFVGLMNGNVQPVTWRLRVSFNKVLDPSVDLFTLDESILDGSGLLAPEDSVVVQPWDKYEYSDYDPRVISMEVTREELDPYSSAKSYADVVLDNHDLFFSPSGGSIIADDVLPRRPIRMFLGFGVTALPLFVGLTEKMPQISRSDMTASFHATDFLSFLYGSEMGETIMLVDQTTSEILDVLLQSLGLVPDQYQLDPSINVIPFFYIKKGQLFGEIADKLMEAELGRLYMNETGVIIFRSRYNYDDVPVMELTTENVIDWNGSNDSKIINSVKITANPREVKEPQPIYQSLDVISFEIGETKVVWLTLPDPVVDATEPIYSATEISSEGYFIASNVGVTITDFEVFAEAIKITFDNSTGSAQTISDLTVWGEPAKPISDTPIEVIQQDTASTDKYEEYWYEINNDYIQSDVDAVTRALTIINDYGQLNSVLELEIKGNPALQVGDAVEVTLPGYAGIFIITKIINILLETGLYQQRLVVKHRELVTFFTLDESVLDGEDVLGI